MTCLCSPYPPVLIDVLRPAHKSEVWFTLPSFGHRAPAWIHLCELLLPAMCTTDPYRGEGGGIYNPVSWMPYGGEHLTLRAFLDMAITPAPPGYRGTRTWGVWTTGDGKICLHHRADSLVVSLSLSLSLSLSVCVCVFGIRSSVDPLTVGGLDSILFVCGDSLQFWY